MNAIKHILQLHILGFMLVIPSSWAQTAVSNEPEQTVNRLHETLLKAMREGEKLGFQGRVALLAPVINQTHDLDFIARTTLGANWDQLNTTQQRTFADVFRKLSIGSYAGWYKSYNGERFEFLKKQPLQGNQVMVRSRLVPLKGDPISFDYILRPGKDGWRIVNILAEGVSDLALKRVEYRAILQRDGFSTLIDMLKKKTALAEQINKSSKKKNS
jgi:phospholipid transport system substrate-binding protein